ncbi:acetyl-CoA synthetase-like protein [Penicillium longicatenatum]|nr:acetyl-CoA synthetase-like protein [Penicillium longicatenatum]
MGADWSGSAQFWSETLQGYKGQTFPRLPSSSIAKPTCDVSKISAWQGASSGITASSIIRAAWSTLLSKYCNSSDIVFGAIVTGRTIPVPDIENIIGPTICAMPVRVQVKECSTVRCLLEKIQNHSGEMMPHEQFGLPRIQALGSSGPAYATKFQSMVIVQPSDLSISVRDDLEIKEVNPELDDYLTYPVTLECFLNKDTITHNLTIDESSINRFEAECLLNQFIHVFETLQDSSMAETKLSQIDIRSPWENDVLMRWNETAAPEAHDTCIDKLIFESSRKCLDMPAIDSWDGKLSYRNLQSISTALAEKLVLEGVRVETVVPIIHYKSLWTLVSVLGVL